MMLRYSMYFGAVVQLVRISACHAEGRGFESRPFRQDNKKASLLGGFFHSKIARAYFLGVVIEAAIAS